MFISLHIFKLVNGFREFLRLLKTKIQKTLSRSIVRRAT